MLAAIVTLVAAVSAIAEAVALIAALSAMLVIIFDPKGKQKVGRLIANVVGGGLGLAVELLNDLEGTLAPIANAFVSSANANGSGIFNIFRDPAAKLAQTVFLDIGGSLEGRGESKPDNAVDRASLAMGNAFGAGLASAGVAAAFEAVFPEKLNTLDGLAPMLGEMAGFQEVASHVLEPLYDAAFGKSLQYHYRALFKPELPDESDAVRWHSQRLLTDSQLRTIFGFSGLKPEYEEAYVASAYRAINPRVLTTLFEDVPFPYDEVKSMLEFGGVRPRDMHVLLDAYEQASTKNVRHQYLSALLTAAERGTIDDSTLDSHLDALNFSIQAKNYVHITVSLRRLEQLAEIYRKSVTVLYETGQLSDAQYVPALEAIGINRADAEAHYAVDSARLRGKVLAAEDRALAHAAQKLLNERIGAIKAVYLAS